jgi:hypothetical protein
MLFGWCVDWIDNEYISLSVAARVCDEIWQGNNLLKPTDYFTYHQA